METNIQSRIALGQEQKFLTVLEHTYTSDIQVHWKKKQSKEYVDPNTEKNTKNTVKSKKFNCNNLVLSDSLL